MLCELLLIYWISAITMIVGALFQDTGKLVGTFVSLWWYFSPGLYIRSDVQQVPEWVLRWLVINPHWAIITSWRNVLLRGEPPDFEGLFIWAGISTVMCIVMALILRRGRRLLLRLAFD